MLSDFLEGFVFVAVGVTVAQVVEARDEKRKIDALRQAAPHDDVPAATPWWARARLVLLMAVCFGVVHVGWTALEVSGAPRWVLYAVYSGIVLLVVVDVWLVRRGRRYAGYFVRRR